MKKQFLSVLCLFCGFALFTSCDNDDDNEGSQPEENQETTIVADTTGTYAQGTTVSGRVNTYTYVDLGLKSGTLWATYNVGASKPTEFGDLFAWGETKPKEEFSWDDYKWSKGDSLTLTKYCLDSNYGTVDNLSTLQADDDAATANWGGTWRMPTYDEQKELFDGCDWERTEDFNGSGIAGLIGTSKANGNTIFFPCASCSNDSALRPYGNFDCYWSSSLDEEKSFSAKLFYYGFGLLYDFDSTNRSYQGSVRAVVK